MEETRNFYDERDENVKKGNTPKETHYLLIVDASSSMTHLTDSTISGINEQIQTIKNLEKEYPDQKYYASLMTFNHEITVEFTKRPASSLENVTKKNYNCSGCTALHDAIGVGLKTMIQSIGKKIDNGDATVVVVIITDGEENSSSVYTGEQVKSMIEELNATERWTISFIGANIDAIATAKSYGINVSNVANYTASDIGTSAVYQTLSRSFCARAKSIDDGNLTNVDFLDTDDIGEDASISDTTKNTETTSKSTSI